MNRKKLMSEAGALIEDVLVSLYLRFIGWANTYYVNATKANDTHKWDFHVKAFEIVGKSSISGLLTLASIRGERLIVPG